MKTFLGKYSGKAVQYLRWKEGTDLLANIQFWLIEHHATYLCPFLGLNVPAGDENSTSSENMWEITINLSDPDKWVTQVVMKWIRSKTPTPTINSEAHDK